MDIRRINLETFLYTIALLLALVFRFYQLGAAPLSDSEAFWALQSFFIANPGQQPPDFHIGPNPGYVFSTGFLFTIIGSSNFLARFWPALAGSIVVLTPGLFRRYIGVQSALIAAFGIAIDPGLVAVSRTAGGPMMALSFILTALGLFTLRYIKSSGILAGMASLCGPSIFFGLGVNATAWFSMMIFKRRNNSENGLEYELNDTNVVHKGRTASLEPLESELANTRWRELLLALGVTILILGTYFFLYPEGLAAWFESILIFFKGWFTPSGVPALRIPVVLIVFQPIALLFAIVMVVRWFSDQPGEEHPDRFVFFLLISTFFASLLFLILYPGREVSGLIWTLVPLWILASWEIRRYLPVQLKPPISLIFAGVVFILCALFWNALITSDQMLVIFGGPSIGIRFALIAGVFLIAALSIVLVSLGWNRVTAGRGLIWGISAALFIYTISLTWNVSINRQNRPESLWFQNPGTGQAFLLKDTLQDISNSHLGMPFEIPILSTVRTPSMRWLLRDFKNTQYLTILPGEGLPDVVITKEVDNLPAGDRSYRGQDFVWNLHPGWAGILPPDFLSWITFHNAPATPEMVILWANSNLFPDYSGNNSDENLDLVQ